MRTKVISLTDSFHKAHTAFLCPRSPVCPAPSHHLPEKGGGLTSLFRNLLAPGSSESSLREGGRGSGTGSAGAWPQVSPGGQLGEESAVRVGRPSHWSRAGEGDSEMSFAWESGPCDRPLGPAGPWQEAQDPAHLSGWLGSQLCVGQGGGPSGKPWSPGLLQLRGG